jgi:hypothetical protein
MSNPILNPNEASAGPGRRFLTWLSDYAWLLAGCLFVLVFVQSGSDQAEDASMRENRERIEDMPRTDRERLRHNQSEFESLTADEEKRCRELHNAIAQDDKLDRTLSAWHNWLATLSIDQREKIMRTKDTAERIKLIRSVHDQERPRRDWPGRRMFDGQWGRGPKSSVRFGTQDYEAMLQSAGRWCEIATEPTSRDPKAILAHHVLIVTELLDRVFPGWDRFGSPNGPRMSRPRPEFPAELRDSLINAIRDPAIKRMLRDRSDSEQSAASQSFMLMSFFVRGLFDEARRLVAQQRPTEDDRLAIYLKLPEEKRAELDRLPREFFNNRIQWMSMLKTLDPDTAHRFDRLSNLLERMSSRGPGSGQNPGRRPEGDGLGRPGERPPGRFGEGRPGQPPPFEGRGNGPPRDPPPPSRDDGDRR